MPGTIVNGTLASGVLSAGEQNLWNIIRTCEATYPISYGQFFSSVCRQTASALLAMPGHHISVQKAPYKIVISGPYFNVTYESNKIW
jgi:hypothetical protein